MTERNVVQVTFDEFGKSLGASKSPVRGIEGALIPSLFSTFRSHNMGRATI
jgi:hypothetical protein